MSDWSTQGLGVFVDDVSVSSGGVPLASTSFEDGLGGWAVPGPPPDEASASADFTRSQQAFEEGAGVATPDTVFVGFGVEGLTTEASATTS